jgi:hypothetical protein
MALPYIQSNNQDIMLLQTKWVPQINPVLASSQVQGLQLTNIPLSSGTNVINHKLGRAYQGYYVTGMHGNFVQLYDTPSPMPTLTLVLQSSGAGNIDLFVY